MLQKNCPQFLFRIKALFKIQLFVARLRFMLKLILNLLLPQLISTLHFSIVLLFFFLSFLLFIFILSEFGGRLKLTSLAFWCWSTSFKSKCCSASFFISSFKESRSSWSCYVWRFKSYISKLERCILMPRKSSSRLILSNLIWGVAPCGLTFVYGFFCAGPMIGCISKLETSCGC